MIRTGEGSISQNEWRVLGQLWNEFDGASVMKAEVPFKRTASKVV